MTVDSARPHVPSADDCALVVIDMHRGHIGPQATIPVPDAEAIVPTLSAFLAQAREFAIPIVHVRHESVDGIHNQQPVWLLKGWPADHCVPGSATTEFVIVPEPDDYVIAYKRTFNAFAHTDLDLYLRRLGRHTIAITGLTSDCCCLATAFGAVDLHYAVVAVSDCQQGMDLQSHTGALRIVEDVLGQVMTSIEFLAMMRGGGNDQRAASHQDATSVGR
jgi:nicotinamidase-related amidase